MKSNWEIAQRKLDKLVVCKKDTTLIKRLGKWLTLEFGHDKAGKRLGKIAERLAGK